MMQKKNIIYNNLIRLLSSLTMDSALFESFYDNLSNDDQNNLLLVSEEIEKELKELIAYKHSSKIYSSFDNLVSLLNTFQASYPNFPGARIKEVLVLIEMISSLSNSVDDEINLEEELDVTQFSLVPLEKPIHTKNFFYYDNDQLLNSIVLIDLSDIDSIDEYFDTTPLPTELYFHLIEKIGRTDITLEDKKYVLVRTLPQQNNAAVWSCLAMHLVKEGLLVHRPYLYNLKPVVSNQRKVYSGKNYQQFNDSLIILSEYNDQKDILDKYLRLYHVIENFMYKFPLVSLERKHNGRVFSIRDFQRMFDRINTNEKSSLVRLIKRVCDEEYEVGTNFSQLIVNRWNELVSVYGADETKVNLLLKRLRITRKNSSGEDVDIEFDDLVTTNSFKIFAEILYAFRNSLVHNRETEFHLTHESLLWHPEASDSANLILKYFLIPMIEEIIFFLLVEENEIVWFRNSNLILYETE